MFKHKNLIFIGFFILGAGNIYAEDNSEALQKTQDCLRNQSCSEGKTGAGKEADQKASDAVGGDATKKQALYNISADIMPYLVKKSGGDPAKMQKMMLQAQKDPEGFFNSLPPEIRAKISDAAVD